MSTRDALQGDITDACLQVELQTLAHEEVLADGEATLVDTMWFRWPGLVVVPRVGHRRAGVEA